MTDALRLSCGPRWDFSDSLRRGVLGSSLARSCIVPVWYPPIRTCWTGAVPNFAFTAFSEVFLSDCSANFVFSSLPRVRSRTSRMSTSPSGPAGLGPPPSSPAPLAPSSVVLSAGPVPSDFGRLSSFAGRLLPSGGRLPSPLALAFWRLPSPSPVAFWPRPFAAPLFGSAELCSRPSSSLPAWPARKPTRILPRSPRALPRPQPIPTSEPSLFLESSSPSSFDPRVAFLALRPDDLHHFYAFAP